MCESSYRVMGGDLGVVLTAVCECELPTLQSQPALLNAKKNVSMIPMAAFVFSGVLRSS
jgi:hypothetical protein